MSQGSNINVCVISGEIDATPRVNTTKNNTQAISLTLAVRRQVNTADGMTNMTSWFNVGSFNQAVVETCSKLDKGDKVIVQGSLAVRTWMDQASGQKKIRYEISADRVTVLSGDASSSSMSSNTLETDVPDELFS